MHIYIYIYMYTSKFRCSSTSHIYPPSIFTSFAPSTTTSGNRSWTARWAIDLGLRNKGPMGNQRCVPWAGCMAFTNSSTGSLRKKKVFCHATMPAGKNAKVIGREALKTIPSNFPVVCIYLSNRSKVKNRKGPLHPWKRRYFILKVDWHCKIQIHTKNTLATRKEAVDSRFCLLAWMRILSDAQGSNFASKVWNITRKCSQFG